MDEAWYQKTETDVLKLLKTSAQGLSKEEVLSRLKTLGENKLPEEAPLHWLTILIGQFKSPLVYLLVFAGLVTLWLKEWTDAAVIFFSVAINAGIGFYQEYHSGNILQSLKRTVKSTAIVLRNGNLTEIDASGIVPGDILLIKSGMKIPADARLLSAERIEINESLLTGESNPVKKEICILQGNIPLAERKNMVFMGTTVESGAGSAVATATGAKTEIGLIAKLAKEIKDEETPLQKRIARLGKILVNICAGSVIIIFAIGLAEGRSIVEMLTTSIAVAVAAIPEGLLAALAVVLSVAAQRIYRRNGLIRKLIAAETLGSISVICTDKTGTLTRGLMNVERIETIQGTDKKLFALALGLANEALIEQNDGKAVVKGESTDRAKMEKFLESGYNLKEELEAYPRIAFVPFDPKTRYIASFHKNGSGGMLFITGAPEALLNISENAHNPALVEKIEFFARSGYRVIAAAFRKFDALPDLKEQNLDHFINNLTFLGFAAIRDSIRPDVYETIAKTREAGIQVVMITGDHIETAQVVGRELDFRTETNNVLDGQTLDVLTDAELEHRIADIEIFARVTPAHKIRIVQAWQKHGASVAMTGDGVNDAPSLKAADIGVALGSGTETAKDASELVLLDDSFSTITHAIEQGRIAFDNFRKVAIFLLNGTFTEIILVMSAVFLKLPLPFAAAQILWMNLVEDGLPNFALAFEPGEKDIMKRKPLDREEPILNRNAKTIVYAAGLTGDLLLVGLFITLAKFSAIALPELQTIFFAAVGTDALINVFTLKSLTEPLYKIKLFNNPYLIAAVGIGFTMMIAAIYAHPLNLLLKTVPLSLNYAVIVIAYFIIRAGLIEIVKWRYRSVKNR